MPLQHISNIHATCTQDTCRTSGTSQSYACLHTCALRLQCSAILVAMLLMDGLLLRLQISGQAKKLAAAGKASFRLHAYVYTQFFLFVHGVPVVRGGRCLTKDGPYATRRQPEAVLFVRRKPSIHMSRHMSVHMSIHLTIHIFMQLMPATSSRVPDGVYSAAPDNYNVPEWFHNDGPVPRHARRRQQQTYGRHVLRRMLGHPPSSVKSI